jgi:Mannosyl-glycoprotein endo-beta-N-acetylglucosaminidase
MTVTTGFAFRLATARSSIAAAIGLLGATAAAAADLPAIKTTSGNAVPACATPGRLMAFLKSKNARLDARYDTVATNYMRHGEALGLRWDIAFFQMMVETANLAYTGDVKPQQNNFAGLGATGGGEPGESFADVSTGVRAHLEHVAMYSGEQIDSPVAERTRKVQEWGVLTKWQHTIHGPMTYAQLAHHWAPKSRGYVRDIEAVEEAFMEGPCHGADPAPELVAAAHEGQAAPAKAKGKAKAAAVAAAEPAAAEAAAEPTKGAELAKQAIKDAKASGSNRSALGAGMPEQTPPPAPEASAAAPAASANAPAKVAPAYTLLNGTPAGSSEPQAAAPATAAAPAAAPAAEPMKVAAAADAVHQAAPAAPGKGKCHVWTASYGGTKAMIIKAVTVEGTNYTVLDVHEGAEKREAEAYIAAYAKGGQSIEEHASEPQALERAFQLCPEG